MSKIGASRACKKCGLHSTLAGVVCILAVLLWSCGADTVVPVHEGSIGRETQSLSDGEPPYQPLPIIADPRFEYISVEEGLSQSTVFSTVQDSQGYMWFGTEDGLNRYDGYSFRIYRNDPDNPNTLSDDWVTSIVEDHAGVIWIGTLGGGINRYDRGLDQFVRYTSDPENPNSLIHNEVTVILEDGNGELWIGTRRGLSRYDRQRDVFRNFRDVVQIAGNPLRTEILTLHEDSRGLLWAGTAGAGLGRFDRATESFTYRPADRTGDNAGRNDVRSIQEDNYGRLWIGTAGGLTIFDPGADEFTDLREVLEVSDRLNETSVHSLFTDPDGILWVGTWSDGLFVIDPERGQLQNYIRTTADGRGLNSQTVVSTYQDREGTLWIGTTTGGVNKLTVDNRTFAHYRHDPNNPNSLSDDWVRSILEDDEGVLWITTGGSGLNRYDRAAESWRNWINDPGDPQSLADDFLSWVSQDSAGTLWIATEKGVDRLDTSTGDFTHFRDDETASADDLDTNRIRHIYQDSSDRMWVSRFGGGMAEMDPDNGTFASFMHDPADSGSLIHDTVWFITEDSRGEFWISTSAGLDRFDPETGTFTHFRADPSDSESLSDHAVGSVVEDRFGTLWIGTFGGGLNRFDRESETFSRWGVEDGLPNNVIYAIEIDDSDHLWVSTNNGISRFDPRSETFTNYQLKDGLPIVEFNGRSQAKGRSGELFFGGINGFVSFMPSSVRKNPYVPPVVIESFSYGGERLRVEAAAPAITIRWPEDSFEFEYAALSYSNPALNQYAYMLEGLDHDWIEAGTSRVGRYDRLPGGVYTLRVIGSNDDGVWNDTGASLQIAVVPPFWASWWFRVVAAVLILGAAVGVVGLRVRNMRERNKRLEREVAERTADLKREAAQRLAAEESLHQAEMEGAVAAERSRLARELHDSVTQSLYSLTLFTEATRELADAGDLDQVKHGLVRSGDTALQALREMRLLVYELRPLALRETSLIEAIQYRLDAVEARAGMKTNLVIDGAGEMRLPEELEEAAFRIAQEALNNALKHSHATSITVSIGMRAGDSGVELEILDDGIGFDLGESGKKGGIGLSGMKERAEQIRGDITIESAPGKGTRVRLKVRPT